MPVTTLTALTTEELQEEDDQEDEVEGFTNEVFEADEAGRVSSFVKNEPNKRQYGVIQAVHNSIAGHQGVENTLAKLKRRDERWEFMRRHVEWFIKHCPECQKLSQVKEKNNPQQFTVSSYYPRDRLAMDFAAHIQIKVIY